MSRLGDVNENLVGSKVGGESKFIDSTPKDNNNSAFFIEIREKNDQNML